MTVKEIADFCGRSSKSVRRWIAKLQNATPGQNVHTSLDKMYRGISEKNEIAIKNGIPADFNIDEVEAILKASSLSKDAVSILMKNARDNQLQQIEQQGNVNRDLAPISKMQSFLTPRDMDLISSVVSLTVAKTLEHLETRLSKIENIVGGQNQIAWNNDLDVRTRINILVRKYAAKNNMDIKSVWHSLYKTFGYKTHSNPSVSARNRGMSIIDYIESEGQLDILEKVAQGMVQPA